jgi:hypothetical protein
VSGGGPLESSTQALERIKREIDPKELEGFFGVLVQTLAAVNDGQPELARELLARLMRTTAGLHCLIFLEVPTWCPPQLRAHMEDAVKQLRGTIEEERQVGAQPAPGSLN